jgi:glycosyltransferase involved in cell wall biosynthesis
VNSPRVSVIIPAFNSADTIAECLGALRQQTFRDFEVIIVNSSPDETSDIVRREFPEVFLHQAAHRLLPHAARNRGAKHARGEILVFSDPDCRAHGDWLERIVAAQDAGHELVCGAIDLRDTASWFERGVHLAKYSFRSSALPAGPTWIAGTANACCSRALWNEIGPFDGEHFSGDAQFSWRAAERGHVPWFEPSAIVEHRYSDSLHDLIRERFLRGEDFARARSEFEQWSRARSFASAVAFPAAITVVLARELRDAMNIRWMRTLIASLPLQIVAHGAWILGESRAYTRYAMQSAARPAVVEPHADVAH